MLWLSSWWDRYNCRVVFLCHFDCIFFTSLSPGARFIFHIKWKHCEGKEASTIIFWPLWWQSHMCWRKWRYRTRIMKQVFRSERCFVNLLLGCVVQLLSFLMDKDIYLGNETNLVTHSNSEIIATVSCNCSANVRLLVSEGFINLMYFNPYPL